MLEAIILAGGFGTRLRESVPNLPKPMAPIGKRPFLEILLESLASKGFDRIVLSLGYMADKVSTHFGSSYAGMEIDYVVEESPLGTGGAVRLALTKCQESKVFIFNGDTFLDIEASGLSNLQDSSAPWIVATEIKDTNRYGCLLVEDNRLLGFAEKKSVGPGLINAGCYLLDKSSLDEFPLYSPFSLETDFFMNIVTEVRVQVFVSEGKFIDIGIPEDYELAQTLLAQE